LGRRRIVPRASRVVQWVTGVAVSVAAGSAQAQSNLDAGKSPAQIFSDTCNACHRSARELKQTSPGFLRDHYATGAREAAAMAAYLATVGSDPRAVQQRRPPTLGAGQSAATESSVPRPPQTTPPGSDQGRAPETQAALPGTTPGRRAPSEQGKQSPGPATAAAVKSRRPSESMEAGRLSEGGAADVAPSQPAAAPRPNPVHELEE
jgi:hypothetical protein